MTDQNHASLKGIQDLLNTISHLEETEGMNATTENASSCLPSWSLASQIVAPTNEFETWVSSHLPTCDACRKKYDRFKIEADSHQNPGPRKFPISIPRGIEFKEDYPLAAATGKWQVFEDIKSHPRKPLPFVKYYNLQISHLKEIHSAWLVLISDSPILILIGNSDLNVQQWASKNHLKILEDQAQFHLESIAKDELDMLSPSILANGNPFICLEIKTTTGRMLRNHFLIGNLLEEPCCFTDDNKSDEGPITTTTQLIEFNRPAPFLSKFERNPVSAEEAATTAFYLHALYLQNRIPREFEAELSKLPWLDSNFKLILPPGYFPDIT